MENSGCSEQDLGDMIETPPMNDREVRLIATQLCRWMPAILNSCRGDGEREQQETCGYKC